MGPDDLHDLSQPLVHGPGVGLPPLSARDVHIQGPVKIVEIQQRLLYSAVSFLKTPYSRINEATASHRPSSAV